MANLSKGRDAKLKGLHYDGSQLPKDEFLLFLRNLRGVLDVLLLLLNINTGYYSHK
jgi:hypothetical protein